MSKNKSKSYFFYYLKENILIFDVSNYIDELAVHTIDFLFEWDLLKKTDEKFLVTCKQKLLKELVEIKIEKEIEQFKKTVNDNNCKMLSYFSTNSEPKEWKNYFTDPLKFVKICKKICKKNLPNFIETKTSNSLFQKRKGCFLDFSCIIPSGEDEEFIVRMLDKIKKLNK